MTLPTILFVFQVFILLPSSLSLLRLGVVIRTTKYNIASCRAYFRSLTREVDLSNVCGDCHSNQLVHCAFSVTSTNVDGELVLFGVRCCELFTNPECTIFEFDESAQCALNMS